jgi:hypothetical protein
LYKQYWEVGHWITGKLESCKSGQLEIWKTGKLGNLKTGNLEKWTLELMSTRVN